MNVCEKFARQSRIQSSKCFSGQNILGYKHYPDDVLIEFIKRVVGNGIDIIRIFDALNDVRNLETAMSAAVKEGAHAQAALSYTISPIHNTQHYIDTAKMLESMGASSICIKDMAGLLKPYTAYELVSELKGSQSTHRCSFSLYQRISIHDLY